MTGLQVIFTALAALILAEGAGAQSGSSIPDSELRQPTVTVTGTREEQARAFVERVQPKGWEGAVKGVPRWNSELCISVIGPPVEQGHFIADRISQRAMDVGLEAGAPGCDTNLLVIVTNDPDALLPAIARKHRAVFGFTGDANVDTGGSEASLAQFIEADSPVRWRQVIQVVGADGMPLDGDAMVDPLGYNQDYYGTPPGNLPIVRADSTRLRSAVRRELSRVVAVVDTRQTAGLGLGAVADYLAFVTLADVSAEADMTGFPSILNLFNPQAERQASMTDWDLAFLDGLYASKPDAASGTRQYGEIARRIAKAGVD